MHSDRQATIVSGSPQVATPTSAGVVGIPGLYRDGSILGLIYRVSPRSAQTLIGDQPFDPLLVAGKAIVLLAAFEHRDFSGGPYNEVALGVQVTLRGAAPRLLGFPFRLRTVAGTALHIVNLAVTTNIAMVAGIELWGFPKYLAEIDTAFRPNNVEVVLGSEIVLSHCRRFGCSIKSPPFVTYSILEGRVIRTVVECGHRIRFGGANTVQLKVSGPGPMSNSIRTLGLDASRPACAFRSDAVTMILPLGRDIGAAADSSPRGTGNASLPGRLVMRRSPDG